jgi:DNA-binding response OmpR family regulator
MQQKRIMIADDDAAIVDVIELILSFEGYEVKSTMRGETLLDMNTDFLICYYWTFGYRDGMVVKSAKNLKRSSLKRNADHYSHRPARH